MHPAPSIIFFTTSSGAGYGLLCLLALGSLFGVVPNDRWLGFVGFCLSLGLITVGLMASTYHLGHPERAWRAVTQWRSSWLSREGVLALLTYVPALGIGFGWVFLGSTGGGFALLALLAAIGAVITVYCTGMIYGSLKPIREWHQPLVAPIYLAFALMTGALLLHALLALFGVSGSWAGWLALGATLLAYGLKARYWQIVGQPGEASTPASATGLGGPELVRMVDPPHTQTNYLLQEMGFVVARKHAQKLRRLSYVFGVAGAGLLTLLAIATSGFAAGLLAALAAVSGIGGVVIERWLFFAEASHTVMLYYGGRRAA